MTSENFEEIFQLIKDDISKESTKMRELIQPRLWLAATYHFFSTGELQELCLRVLFFLLNNEQFNIYFFSRFRLLHFFLSNDLSDFLCFPQNFL